MLETSCNIWFKELQFPCVYFYCDATSAIRIIRSEFVVSCKRGDLYQILPYMLSLCSSVLEALETPRLGKRGLVCVLFAHSLVLRMLLVCLFPLLLVVRDWLRFVIVAVPGLFILAFCGSSLWRFVLWFWL